MNSVTIWTISLFEIAYIVYMYNYFKTTLEVHHPLEMLITNSLDWLKHPMDTGLYENKICPIGNIVSLLLGALIIFRAFSLDTVEPNVQNIQFFSLIATALVFLGSLLTNMNAFIYLIPIYLLEWKFIQTSF